MFGTKLFATTSVLMAGGNNFLLSKKPFSSLNSTTTAECQGNVE